MRLVLFLPRLLVLVFVASPAALAQYELPPEIESYEIYYPLLSRSFNAKSLWLRADLRIRPEWRNGVCFGGGAPAGGACNTFNAAAGTSRLANAGKGANDFYVHQWARLGIGYDLSPDVNFYFEIIDNATWGANGTVTQGGSNNSDALHHSCGQATSAGGGVATADCRLGVRAGYMLVRNLGGIQGLSMKAGRQYVVFGNHSLFGHFDWANTGYSHDGIMFQYSTKAFETHVGWFKAAETDIAQAAPVGSLEANVAGAGNGRPDGSADSDWFIVYNQIKSVPGFLIEPYYVLFINNMHESVNTSQGIATPKHASQTRHMVGNRLEMRKGNWDLINETAWQFGRQADGIGGDNQRNLTINAWATRNWFGYTAFEHNWKPRFAVGFDYASGDGNANCSNNTVASTGYRCKTANTFENFYPTNYIHAGYMLNHAWRNAIQPQVNIQFKPTARDHVEFWGQLHYLANARDNWYRGAQGVYVYSQSNNTKTHVGDEIDLAWTHLFADGKVSLTATWGHFFAGSYVRQNLGTQADQDWAMLQLWMNF